MNSESIHVKSGTTVSGGSSVTRTHSGSAMPRLGYPFVLGSSYWSCSVSGDGVVSDGWYQQSVTLQANYESVLCEGTRYASTGPDFAPYPNITFGDMTCTVQVHPHLYML
tara:strand:- start:134 stop:463 length:330 start_codon:yes stop_codon:yes gene_type:complete